MNYRNWMPLLLILLVAPLVLAQENPRAAPGEEMDTELRTAMRRMFENRMRAALQLSDSQMTEIQPHVERLEALRGEARRDRVRTVQQLRNGLADGASDAVLEGLLERLETIESDERAQERQVLALIDDSLSVRQRVQFRFFVERFRRELAQRVNRLRGERGRGGRRAPRDMRQP